MNNLQTIRKSKNLTQNQLSKISGVNISLLTKYESGEKNINRSAAETLYKLACALDCSMEDLLEK